MVESKFSPKALKPTSVREVVVTKVEALSPDQQWKSSEFEIRPDMELK